MERNRRLLNLRHPGYDALVQRFLAEDPVAPSRRQLDEARLAEGGRPHVLLLTLGLPGGVARFVEAQCRRLRTRGLEPLLLRPSRRADDVCALVTADGDLRDLRYAVPRDLPALQALLQRLAIEHVELHHFLGLDERVVELALALGRPFDVYVHDYSLICPRLTLLGGDGRYCGEPALTACESCVAAHGSELPAALTVRALRRRSRRWLKGARQVLAPSRDAAVRLQRYIPGRRPQIETWEAPAEPASPIEPDRLIGTGGPIEPDHLRRVAVIGAIGRHKGYQVLLDCARDAARRDLPLEFVVIGYSEDDEALLSHR
jgi:hypothetical protein